jgi:hypothetical protein
LLSLHAGLGLAFPPRRLVETAAAFGSNGIVQSICQADFSPAIDALIDKAALRIAGSCE